MSTGGYAAGADAPGGALLPSAEPDPEPELDQSTSGFHRAASVKSVREAPLVSNLGGMTAPCTLHFTSHRMRSQNREAAHLRARKTR